MVTRGRFANLGQKAASFNSKERQPINPHRLGKYRFSCRDRYSYDELSLQGMLTVTVVPSSNTLSILTVPWCISMMDLDMNSPKPVPLSLFVSALLTL